MNRKLKIGLYDSGVGGLTVFKALKEILPDEDYLYFGDLKNMPYGERSPEELVKIADLIFKFFEKKGADFVVMACNTTSATVYEVLKNNYSFKIYPIIQSCANVIAGMPAEKIGVFATKATIKSHAYEIELKKFNPNLQVFEMACPEWVKIVENGLKNEPQSIECIKTSVDKMMLNQPDKIILGCTHYPFLIDVLSKFAPRDIFVDPAEYFAKFIKDDIDKNIPERNSTGKAVSVGHFYVSENPEHFQKSAKIFYDIKDLPEIINV